MSIILPLTGRQVYIYSCHLIEYSACRVRVCECVFTAAQCVQASQISRLHLAMEIFGKRVSIQGRKDQVKDYVKYIGCIKSIRLRQIASKDADEAGTWHCKARFLS